MKTLPVLLAAGGLLLASQNPAQAQVSFGIPLPFPFLFYRVNSQPPPYYGQQTYYGQPQARVYYGRVSRVTDCTPARSAYFHRPAPRTYYYGPPVPPGYSYYGPAPGFRYYGPGWGGYGGW